MHKYFLFTLSACLISMAGLQAQHSLGEQVLQAATQKLEHAKTYTLQVAALMPADQYSFKPTPESMSFGAQLLHIATNLGWLNSSYLQPGDKVTNPVTTTDAALQNKDSIMQVLEKSYSFALQTLRQFKPTSLTDTVSFFAGPLTKLQILTLVNDHQTHHRGQLMVYLRLKGLVPPKYVGW